MIYFFSDPHFNHRAMAEMFTVTRTDGTTHKARPFTTVQEHDDVMFANYIEMVTGQDTVWWLGDVCFKPTEKLIERIAALPGTKHLIMGNHDRESVGRYRRMGFGKLRSSWTTEGLLVTHIPVHPRSLSRKVAVNVHGHTHSTCYGYPYINVSVEQTGYSPISLDAVLHLAGKSKKCQVV